LETELAARMETIEQERFALLQQTREDVETEIAEVRDRLRDVDRHLKRTGAPPSELKDVESELETLEEQWVESVSNRMAELELPERSLDSVEDVFRVGDRVRLRTIDAEGLITAINQEQAEVQVGRLRVRARLDELLSAKEEPSVEHPPSEVQHVISRGISQAPPVELNLRGRTVDEGLEELDRRLDAAYLAGMPFVRVIHGKGTGRLREAIRRALKDNPYVSSFEPGKHGEGGEGVTVVRLAVS
jgi:DNA mismatch repair protein MutS2